MPHPCLPETRPAKTPWNKGSILGQKRPLLAKHARAIRVRLEMARRIRDLALFNLAIDSKARGWGVILQASAGILSLRLGPVGKPFCKQPECDLVHRPTPRSAAS